MNNQRATLSTNSKYYIPKFRYLELKNFCFQYPEWRNDLKELSYIKCSDVKAALSSDVSKPTEFAVLRKLKLEEKINLIEAVAMLADPFLSKWIVKGATEGYTYEYLHMAMDMPAGRSTYYDRYRKFFWLLDQKRN